MQKNKGGPKVLLLDIETSYLEVSAWRLWENNIALNQLKKDWSILSWSAKWLDNKEMFYQDMRGAKNVREDKKILKGIWELLDEADIIVTQNGKAFDAKKLNARFVINGFRPPSSYKHIDTKQLAKKTFGFTSNSLEYLADVLGVKFKKLKHKKFPGMELWDQCLSGNVEAWKEMERYNKRDVLALEEVYKKLRAWDTSVNFNLYFDEEHETIRNCGSKKIQKNGYCYTSAGKYQRYACAVCGAEVRGNKALKTVTTRGVSK